MKKFKLFGVLLLSVAVLGACSSNSSNETKKETADAAKNSSEENKDYSFENNTLTTKNAVISYTGAEKSTDYNGAPIAYLFFTVTNKKEEAQNVQMFFLENTKISQNLGDTTKDLEYGMTMESPYQDKLDMLNQNLNPEGTAEIVYPVSIADETKPITITFKDGYLSKDVGTIEVPLS